MSHSTAASVELLNSVIETELVATPNARSAINLVQLEASNESATDIFLDVRFGTGVDADRYRRIAVPAGLGNSIAFDTPLRLPLGASLTVQSSGSVSTVSVSCAYFFDPSGKA